MLYFAPVSLLSHSNFGYSMYPKLRFRSPVNLQGDARLELLPQYRHRYSESSPPKLGIHVALGGNRVGAILTTEVGAWLRDIVEMKAKIIPLHGVAKSKTSCSPPNKHQHRCPLCRRVTMETDEVCGLSIDHVFACVPCLKDYRSGLESDSDVVGDVDLD